jgi:hypothetical protein
MTKLAARDFEDLLQVSSLVSTLQVVLYLLLDEVFNSCFRGAPPFPT